MIGIVFKTTCQKRYKRKLCWVVAMEQGPEAGLERLIKMLVCLGRMPVFVNRHRPVHWQ